MFVIVMLEVLNSVKMLFVVVLLYCYILCIECNV